MLYLTESAFVCLDNITGWLVLYVHNRVANMKLTVFVIRNRPLGKPGHRWEVNIKTAVIEIIWKGVH